MEQDEAEVSVDVRKDAVKLGNVMSNMPTPKSSRLPTLSVIMPCLNEQENVASAIQRTLDAFERHGINGEIIVINDGSTDGTAGVVRKMSERHTNVHLIEHTRPRGIGVSFWDGVRNAHNDFVTMFPGDDENDPDDALLCYYLTRDVDIIVPFIHKVDYVFNGSLPYELCAHRNFLHREFPAIVKKYETDPKKIDAFIRAKRVDRLLGSLEPFPDPDFIPVDSFLREFIGGGSYQY